MRYNDPLLDTEYTIKTFNARELSTSLKDFYKKSLNINVDDYNEQSYNDRDNKGVPLEIYQYQNFFLYENDKGDYILLDGFRRLLWYDVPDMDIQVRIYKELSNKQLIALTMSLNHTKLYSSQTFFNRGFALFYKSFFNIDILKFKKSYSPYFSKKESQTSYSSSSNHYKQEELNNSIKREMAKDYYLENLLFLQSINDLYPVITCGSLGSFVREITNKYNSNINFHKFNELFINDKTAQTLYLKLQNSKQESSFNRSINELLDLFTNYVKILNGEETVKSFTELTNDIKDQVKEYKKKGYKILNSINSINNLKEDEYDIVAFKYPVKSKNYEFGLTKNVTFYKESGNSINYNIKVVNIKIDGFKGDSQYSNYSRTYPFKKIRFGQKVNVLYKIK